MNELDFARKVDIMTTKMESEIKFLKSENEKFKRVLGSVLEEWDKEGVIDIDVLKMLLKNEV